jgi:hypothetical protein
MPKNPRTIAPLGHFNSGKEASQFKYLIQVHIYIKCKLQQKSITQTDIMDPTLNKYHPYFIGQHEITGSKLTSSSTYMYQMPLFSLISNEMWSWLNVTWYTIIAI